MDKFNEQKIREIFQGRFGAGELYSNEYLFQDPQVYPEERYYFSCLIVWALVLVQILQYEPQDPYP